MLNEYTNSYFCHILTCWIVYSYTVPLCDCKMLDSKVISTIITLCIKVHTNAQSDRHFVSTKLLT